MEREDFEKSVKELYYYFRLKTFPTEDEIDLWFLKVKPIPIEALKWIIDLIETGEGVPKNIPMAMWSGYTQWKKSLDHPDDYNPLYDDRFPVYKMHKAVDILELDGNDAFLTYCDKHKMPESDRERCRCKLQAYFNWKAELEKIGHSVRTID